METSLSDLIGTAIAKSAMVEATGHGIATVQSRRMIEMEMTAVFDNGDFSAKRADRVCWFVMILGLLNVFDMYMTLRAMEYGIMFEANPIARFVIDHHGRVGVSLFKSVCVGTALIFFVAGRRLKLCELSCLMALAVYCSVAVMWIMYPWQMFLNCL